MSGPKDYSPPPKYSMKAFSGNLNEVFQLQTRIKSQLVFIQDLYIDDKEFDIRFDCKEDLDKIKSTLNEFLKPLIFNYKGTFNQATYNKIESEISQRLNSLNKLKGKLDNIEQDFDSKKIDYESYLEYIKYNTNSKISFNDFKQEICHYYTSEVKEVDKNIIVETISKIDKVHYMKPNDNFQFGFTNSFEKKKEDIINYTKKKESEINTIRTKVSDQIIKASGAITFEKKKSKSILEIESKINLIVDECNDIDCKREYHKKLKLLSESDSFKEEYYYKELFDSIYVSEKNRKNKQELKSLLIDLNNASINKKYSEKKTRLSNEINKGIDANRVSDVALKNFIKDFDSLRLKNTKLIEEEGVTLKNLMITY